MPALQQALSSLVQDLLYIPGLSSQQAGCIVLGYNLKCKYLCCAKWITLSNITLKEILSIVIFYM